MCDIVVKKEPIVEGNEKVEVKSEKEETNTDFNSQFEILGSVITFKDEDTMEVPQFLDNENICQSKLLPAQIPPSIEKGAMVVSPMQTKLMYKKMNEKVVCPSNLSSEQTPPSVEKGALVVHPTNKTKIIYENLRKLLSTRQFAKDVPLPANISENTLNSNAINSQPKDTNSNAGQDFVKSHSIKVIGAVSNKSLSTLTDQTVQPHILKPQPHVVKRVIRYIRKPDSNVNDDKMDKIDYNDSCHHGQSDKVVSSVTTAPQNLQNLQVNFNDCNQSSDSFSCEKNKNDRTRDIPLTVNIVHAVNNFQTKFNGKWVKKNEPFRGGVLGNLRKKVLPKYTSSLITVMLPNDAIETGYDCKECNKLLVAYNYQRLPMYQCRECFFSSICKDAFMSHFKSSIFHQITSNVKKKPGKTRINMINEKKLDFILGCRCELFLTNSSTEMADHLATCKVGNQTCLIMRDMYPVASFGNISMSECAKALNTMTPEEEPVQRNITTDVQYVQTHERLDPQFKDQYSLNVAKGHEKQISTKLSDVPITVSSSPAAKGGQSSHFINNHKASIRVQNNELAFIGKQDDSELQSAGIVSEVSVVDSLMNHFPKVRSIAADPQMNTSSEIAQKAPLKTFQPKAPRLKITHDPTGVRQTSISSRHVSLTLPANYYDQKKTANDTPSSSTSTPRGVIKIIPGEKGQKEVLFFPIGTTSSTTNSEAPILITPPRSDQNTTTSTIQNTASVNALTAKYNDQEQNMMQWEFQPKAPRLTLDPTGVKQTSTSSTHVSLTLPSNSYDQNKTANETLSSSTSTPHGFIVVLPGKKGQKEVLFFPIGTTSTTTNREAPVLTAPPRSDQNTMTLTIQNTTSGNTSIVKFDNQEQKIMQRESDKSEKTDLMLKKSNFSPCPSVRTTMAATQVSSIVSTMGPSTKLLNLAPVYSRKYLPRPYFQKSDPTVHTMYPPTRPNDSASVLSTAFLPAGTPSSTQYDGKNSIQTDISYSTQTVQQNLTPRVSTSSRTPVKVPLNEAMNLINAKSWDTIPMTTPVSKELVRDSTSSSSESSASTRFENSASTRSKSLTMPESTGSVFPLVIFPNVAASQNKGNDLQQGESTHNNISQSGESTHNNVSQSGESIHNNVSQSGESIHNNVPQSGVSQVSYSINQMVPILRNILQSLHNKVQPSNRASNYIHNPVIVKNSHMSNASVHANSHMSNASVPANTGEREKERILWTKQQTGVSAIDQMQPVPDGHLISKGDNYMNAFANIEKDPTQSHNTEIKIEPLDKEYLQTELCRPEVVIENVESNDYYQLYNEYNGKPTSHTKSCSSSEECLLGKMKIKDEFVPMEKNSVVFENIPTESVKSKHFNINSGLFYSSETESCPSDNGFYPSDDEICQSGTDICPLVQNIGSAVQNIGLSNTTTNVDCVDSSLLVRNFPFGKDFQEEGNNAEVLTEPADHRINLIKNQLLQWEDVEGENKMQNPCIGETIARLFNNRQQQSTQDIYVCKVKQEALDETDIVRQLVPEPLNNTVSTDSVPNENPILDESEQNTQQLGNVVEIKQEIPMEADEPVPQISESLNVILPPVVHETEEPSMETEKAVQQIPKPLNANLSPGAAPLSTPGLTQLVITPVYELIDGKIQIKLCLKPLENVLNPKENQEDNFVSLPLLSGPTTDKEGTESSSNTQGSPKNKEKKKSRGRGILPNILSSNMKVSSDTCMKVKKKVSSNMKVKKKVSSNMKVKKKEKGNGNKYDQYVKWCEIMKTRKKRQNEDPEIEMESVCDAVNENETDDLDTTLLESNNVERGDIQQKKENRSVINWDVDLACLEELQTSEKEKQLIDSDDVDLACLEELQTSEEETPLIDSDDVDSEEIQHRREDISLNNSDVFDRREDRLHMNLDIDMEMIKHTEEDNLYTDSDVIDSEENQHRREKNKSLKVFDVDKREEGSSLVESDVFDRSKDRTLIYSEKNYKEDIGHKIKDRSLIDSDIVDPKKVQHRTEHNLLTDSDIVDSEEIQPETEDKSLIDSDIVDSEEIQPRTEDKSLMDSDIVDAEKVQNKTEDGSLMDSDIVDPGEIQPGTENKSLIDSDIVDTEEVQNKTEDEFLMDSDNVDSENIQYPIENGLMIDSDIIDSIEVQLRTKDTSLMDSDIVDLEETQLRTEDKLLIDSDIVDSEEVQLRTKDTSLMDSDIVDTEVIQPTKEDIIKCNDNTMATSDDKLTGTEDSTLASTESPIQPKGDKEETTPLKRSTRCRTKSRKMTENENSTIVTIEGDEMSTSLKGAEETLKTSTWKSSWNEETRALIGCMKFSKINAKITDAAYKKIHGKKWYKDDPAEQIMRLLIFQAIISKTTGKLACRFCTKTFWYEKYLEQHLKLSHLEERSCDQKITDNKFIRYLHEITEDLNKKCRELERALEDKTMLAAPQSSNNTTHPLNKNEENQPKTNASNIKIILTDVTCEDLALLLFVYTIDDWFCQACNRKFYTKNFINELQDHDCGKKYSILYIRPSKTTKKFLSRPFFSVVKDWSKRELCHFRSVPVCFLLNYDGTDCLEEEKSVDGMVKKFRKEFSLKYDMEVLFKKIKEVSCPNCKTKIILDDYKSHSCLPQATVVCYCNICKIGMGSGLQLKAHNFFLHKKNLQHMSFQQIPPIAVRNAESQCPEEWPTAVSHTESQGHQEPPTTVNIAGSQGHQEPPTTVNIAGSQGQIELPTGVSHAEHEGHKDLTTGVSNTESQEHEDLPATASNTDIQGHKEPPTAVSNTESQGHKEPPTAAINTESQERNQLSTWENQNTETEIVQGSEQHQEKDYLIHHVFKWEIAGLNHRMIESILRIIVFYTDIDIALYLEPLDTILKKANFEVETKGSRNSFRIRQKRIEKFNGKHLQKKEAQKVLQKQGEQTVDALPLQKEGEHNVHLQKKKEYTADEVEVALEFYRCKICDKGFRYYVKMRDHMFEEHPEEKNRCKVCQQMFRSRPKLRDHKRNTQHYVRYTPLKKKGGELGNAVPLQKQGEHTVDVLPLQKQGEHGVDVLSLQKQGEHRVDVLSLQKQGERRIDTLPVQKEGELKVDILPLQKKRKHTVETIHKQIKRKHNVHAVRKQQEKEPTADEVELALTYYNNMCKCKICDKGFSDYAEMRDHMFEEHPDEKNRCKVCKQMFRSRQLLKNHVRNAGHYVRYTPSKEKGGELSNTLHLEKEGEHTVSDEQCLANDNGFYKCKHCNKGFSRLVKYKNHLLKDHPDERNRCKICHKMFGSYHMLRRHVKKTKHYTLKVVEKTKTKKVILCEYCGGKFYKWTSLNYHIKHYHSGDKKPRKPRECVLCGKVFVTVAEFASHRKNDHSTQCKICLKTFCDVLHLERHHKLKHLQKKFKCPKCWRTYAFEYMLKMHIKFIHEDYKPYSCDICNYKCYMKNAITSHMKNNH
ncbi:uncharacterized protein LOC134725135 isoform X2 [Mytilus trossulus]|uniref:uncharacterized protein LOC134725135 isoform X2 n=1 Tax=Mytilus trossulus TaxID=6551 RepID=UPI003007AED2